MTQDAMTQDTADNNQADETKEEKKKEPYKPRNKIVAAKEGFYDRLNVSVRQVEIFIGVCVILIIALILIFR